MSTDLDGEVATRASPSTASGTRTDSDFASQGIRCAGWLYRPPKLAKPPVIIMAHGFAGERSFGLPDFAARFVAAGWAVFLFDYRGFGDSDGTPRNDVNPFKHGEDWDAAIDHVRALEAIDTGTMVLWGSSFSGAHVICAAARHADIAAVIAQVPYAGIPSNAPAPPVRELVRLLWHIQIDRLKTWLTGKPHYIPAVGRPGSFAVMNTEESYAGYTALVPPERKFANQVPAKILGMMADYDPNAVAGQVACPALVIAAVDDSLVPLERVEAMARRIPKATCRTLACNHFAPYKGDMFEKNIALQIEFLTQLKS